MNKIIRLIVITSLMLLVGCVTESSDQVVVKKVMMKGHEYLLITVINGEYGCYDTIHDPGCRLCISNNKSVVKVDR